MDPGPEQLNVEVKVIESHGHDIYLRRVQGAHRVIGITDKTKSTSSFQGGVTR